MFVLDIKKNGTVLTELKFLVLSDTMITCMFTY